jgi:hypothetical protein
MDGGCGMRRADADADAACSMPDGLGYVRCKPAAQASFRQLPPHKIDISDAYAGNYCMAVR